MFPAVETLVLRLGLRADSGNARANMPNKPNTGYALSIRRKYVRRAAAPAPPRALSPRPASPRRAQQLGVCTCSPTYRQVKKGSWDRRLTSHECRALKSSSARSCRRESPRPFRFSVPIGVATSRRRLSHRGVRQESSGIRPSNRIAAPADTATHALLAIFIPLSSVSHYFFSLFLFPTNQKTGAAPSLRLVWGLGRPSPRGPGAGAAMLTYSFLANMNAARATARSTLSVSLARSHRHTPARAKSRPRSLRM